MWLCLALSPRRSGWLGQSSRSLWPLFPSPYVSSPFSAACIGRAARGVYPEVDHLSCQGGLIKGLDVQLRVFMVFMGYGKWLSPVVWFFSLSRVSKIAVLLCKFLRVRHRAVAELRDDG